MLGLSELAHDIENEGAEAVSLKMASRLGLPERQLLSIMGGSSSDFKSAKAARRRSTLLFTPVEPISNLAHQHTQPGVNSELPASPSKQVFPDAHVAQAGSAPQLSGGASTHANHHRGQTAEPVPPVFTWSVDDVDAWLHHGAPARQVTPLRPLPGALPQAPQPGAPTREGSLKEGTIRRITEL
jgi:hypothetical protein